MENIFITIEEKRTYLNNLIALDPSNLISLEIIKASQELDLLICQYHLSIATYDKTKKLFP
ncbi:aspartyl-phosphate phosphatase Spo0E family protein [Clostridium grantii]|uniref:Spo0E like sporulation regulatory protein n=1 Tax=Clostridium grantii DSM 8605 TaxID=1121316 RepID=A0A1M5WFM2_9CLOT|nr:aspartyl-phosphate phosphatase Spo0E family protein [Clostridium grantii]SHH86305.1 Spo0E like sporulation regulatory protein [Clostridium grantii DSM 8605]